MIRYIKRCMTKKSTCFCKWAGHFAFIHFSNYKNIYLNGKPLKWHNVLKNGDVIEEFLTPHDFIIEAITRPFKPNIPVPVAPVAPTPADAQGKEFQSSNKPEIKGSNNTISDGVLPYVFGKTQQTPNYAQQAYKLVADGSSTNKLRQFFIANYDNVVYSAEKLGDTLIANYSVDYIDLVTSLGGAAFIGFDNVKPVIKDEELSYNANEQVFQTATYTYNQNTTSTSLQIDFEIVFSNVDTGNWADKDFELQATIIDNLLVSQDLTQSFTIQVGDLVATGNPNEYKYSGTKTWTQNITKLVNTIFQPTADTRGNATETTNQLDCLYTTQDVTTDDFSDSQTLNQSINRYLGTTSEVVETSPPKTVEVDVILSFPQGLYKQQSDGSRINRTAIIDVEYKGSSDTSFKPISDATSLYVRDIDGVKQPLSSSSTTVSGSKVTVNSPADLSNADGLFYRPIGMVLPEDTYTIRVSSADFAEKTNFDIGTPFLNEIHFYINDDILDEDILPDVNQIALEAIAYTGLSGTLKKFNYIAEAEMPTWDGVDWDTIAKTENPAAVIRDLLTNSLVNPRAEAVTDLDNDSLTELYNFCVAEGYKASGVVAEQTKVGEVANEILKNCQSLMIPLLDGKHTFVTDKAGKTPIALFNQHNSFNFKWIPRIGRQTEAIRASYVDNTDYTENELTVYYYDGGVFESPKAGTSDEDYEIIKKDYKYVNDRASVLKIATYELKIIQEKRNTFQFDVNLEGINLKIYDRCYISNTTYMQKESSGLIKNVITSGGNLTGFELYSEIDIPENAKITIRSLDFGNQQPVINIYDVTNSGVSDIIDITPIAYDGVIKGQGNIQGLQDQWFYDGDLFTIGQDTIHDAIIIDIKYNDDNKATITARDY